MIITNPFPGSAERDEDFYTANADLAPCLVDEWRNASAESVATVLAADESADDGRSQWLWIRFANGDLVLACFPQGDTYSATEVDHS